MICLLMHRRVSRSLRYSSGHTCPSHELRCTIYLNCLLLQVAVLKICTIVSELPLAVPLHLAAFWHVIIEIETARLIDMPRDRYKTMRCRHNTGCTLQIERVRCNTDACVTRCCWLHPKHLGRQKIHGRCRPAMTQTATPVSAVSDAGESLCPNSHDVSLANCLVTKALNFCVNLVCGLIAYCLQPKELRFSLIYLNLKPLLVHN
jgi:hypothetical protein